jgi:hypothetical protein
MGSPPGLAVPRGGRRGRCGARGAPRRDRRRRLAPRQRRGGRDRGPRRRRPLPDAHGAGGAGERPFIVWLGSDRAAAELSALNADRRATLPSSAYAANDASPPPIRNAEAGNLALQLLGLPPIPGSVANARQDLVLAEPAAGAAGGSRGNGSPQDGGTR